MPLLMWGKRMLLAAILFGAVATPAHAQFGALKKKMKEKVDGLTQTPAAVTAAAAAGPTDPNQAYPQSAYKPAHRLVITPAVMDQFVLGLRAELAERERLKMLGSTNGEVVKYWKHQDAAHACEAATRSRDAELQSLATQLAASASAQLDPKFIEANMKKQQAMSARMQALMTAPPCDPGPKPSDDQSFFSSLRSAQSQQDGVGATAAGLTQMQYAFLRERVLAVILLEASHPDTRDHAYYTEAELAAIRARAKVILPLVQRDYVPPGERRLPSDVGKES